MRQIFSRLARCTSALCYKYGYYSCRLFQFQLMLWAFSFRFFFLPTMNFHAVNIVFVNVLCVGCCIMHVLEEKKRIKNTKQTNDHKLKLKSEQQPVNGGTILNGKFLVHPKSHEYQPKNNNNCNQNSTSSRFYYVFIREPIGIIKWHWYTVKEVKWRINGCQLVAKILHKKCARLFRLVANKK